MSYLRGGTKSYLETMDQAVRRSRLREEWRSEVATMRRGADADWLDWSPACRANWARQMLEVAREGAPGGTDGADKTWLEARSLR